MDSVEYNFRFIHLYLAKQLAPEERRAFEEELLRNPELQKRLWEQIEIGEAVGSYVSQPVVYADAGHRDEYPEPGAVHKLWYERPVVWVAVAAVLLLMILAIWPVGGGNSRYKEMAENEFQHYPNREIDGLTSSMGTSDPRDTSGQELEIDPLKLAAFKAYVSDNYEEAAETFGQYIQTGKDINGAAEFYQGISFIEIGEDQAAVKAISNYLKKQPQGKYSEPATWYYALLLIKENELEEAQRLLRRLAEEGDVFKTRASGLLEKLKD
ncbi:MAG: hypothetical protein AAF696_12215 [Bacteroidota bacterium]